MLNKLSLAIERVVSEVSSDSELKDIEVILFSGFNDSILCEHDGS